MVPFVRYVVTAIALIGLGLAVVTSGASASVKRVAVTSPVRIGGVATLTVSVSPRARCTLEVTVKYAAGVPRLEGLPAKTGTRITWRFPIGKQLQPGRWPLIVNCGKSGTLRTTITLVR
jgi:hypothetical protein